MRVWASLASFFWLRRCHARRTPTNCWRSGSPRGTATSLGLRRRRSRPDESPLPAMPKWRGQAADCGRHRGKKIRENPPCDKGHCLIRQIGILNRPSRIEGAPAASYPYAAEPPDEPCGGKGKLVSRVIPFYVPACFKSRTKAKSAPTGPLAKVIEFRPAEAKKPA